jgi:NADH-quinone oxidoreductase subunit L
VLFSHAPQVMTIVAIVGVLTALMAASIGLVQYDIKRVLAYSTVSQLGYMFTAMGVGAFSAGAFHLMTHAFFKALLFLGQRLGDPCDGRRAGHAPHGQPEEVHADHLRDDDDRHAGDCRASAVRRVLQQGRDSLQAFLPTSSSGSSRSSPR